MGESTTVVRKGRLLVAIDRYLRRPTREHLQDLEKRGMFEIGLAANIVAESDRHHCEVQVLGEHAEQSWWPDIASKSEQIRCAYHEAITMALDTGRFVDGQPRPVVTTWIHTRVPAASFETYISETDRQVDLFLVTSGASNGGGVLEEPPADARTIMQELWRVGTAEEIDREWARYRALTANNPGYSEPRTSSLHPAIKILNLPGY